jgi:hypothetical protein
LFIFFVSSFLSFFSCCNAYCAFALSSALRSSIIFGSSPSKSSKDCNVCEISGGGELPFVVSVFFFFKAFSSSFVFVVVVPSKRPKIACVVPGVRCPRLEDACAFVLHLDGGRANEEEREEHEESDFDDE